MTPELAPPSPNFHTTITGGRLSLDRFNEHWPPLHVRRSAAIHDDTDPTSRRKSNEEKFSHADIAAVK
ncbi:hypothetical protein TNCV_3635821 [Trichonephila clavipes]|nr:hypothetical protein TNCV_3635821 [Trichonephila clavipes]